MLTHGRFIGAIYLIAALAVVCSLSGTAFAPPPPPREMWLGLEVMQVKGNLTADNKDTFIMSGVFNLEPATLDPLVSDVTLTIDNWSVTIPAASWTQKKEGKPWTTKFGDVTGQIEYWVAGSSKCRFKFSAKNQDLVHAVPHWPNLPVRLQIGAKFDESLIAGLEDKGATGKLSALGPKPIVIPTKVEVKTSSKPDSDTIAAVGRIDMETEGADLSTLGLRVAIQEQQVTIPAGEIPAPKGTKITIKRQIDEHKKLSITIDMNTGKVTILMTGLDLAGIYTPTTFIFEITNLPDGYWSGTIWMAPDAKMTKYLY